MRFSILPRKTRRHRHFCYAYFRYLPCDSSVPPRERTPYHPLTGRSHLDTREVYA